MIRQTVAIVEKDHQPLVTVIMNCFNGEKYLREAIDSIFSQTYQNWEIIFWDNASTDTSHAIANTYKDKRMRYYRGDIKIPLGAARNEALDRVRGEFIAFLDTDDTWYPDKLSTQVAYFAGSPETDLVYSNLLYFGEGSRQKLFKRCFRVPQRTGRVFKHFLQRYPINTQTVMIRTSSLTEMREFFDPQLHLMEDLDLFMRFVHDRNVGYQHKVLAEYRLHPCQESIKRIADFAIEAEYILAKLQRYFPDSKARCQHEYAYFEAKIAYYHSRVALRQGDRAKARTLIYPFRWLDWRFVLLNVSLHMPDGAFVWLHKITGRYH